MLRHRRQDVNGQLVDMRITDGHELDSRVHQGRDERQIAGETV
jgi:hypothetical protein